MKMEKPSPPALRTFVDDHIRKSTPSPKSKWAVGIIVVFLIWSVLVVFPVVSLIVPSLIDRNQIAFECEHSFLILEYINFYFSRNPEKVYFVGELTKKFQRHHWSRRGPSSKYYCISITRSANEETPEFEVSDRIYSQIYEGEKIEIIIYRGVMGFYFYKIPEIKRINGSIQ
jgi:hypothetical protein